ncbi:MULTISPECIES: hypothetical protein [Pseudomonadaceae]|uniref:hypothetical protein n=1 Tax=Pseudomonadaceae TaxID=135621 RepID=UPI00084B478E|nr:MULTISPECIES: hypothetical protein [Pseudomonas]OEC59447.1 hypothetical protein A9G05_11060 [Pseudomonas sp. ENNP23]
MAEAAPDWDAIHAEYRAGQLSNVMLGKKYGVTEGAIRKRAKAEGWQKDLADAVRQQVKEKLVRDEVRAPNARDREIVEAAATTGADVVRRHRRDISKGQDIVSMLFGQLEEAASNRAELEDAIEEETKNDETTRRRTQLMRLVSLASHAGVLRDLSAAMKNLIPLERQAYNLDEQEHEEPYEERLRRLLGQE